MMFASSEGKKRPVSFQSEIERLILDNEMDNSFEGAGL